MESLSSGRTDVLRGEEIDNAEAKSQNIPFPLSPGRLVGGRLPPGFPSLAAQSWNEDSYEDFADGRLDASGQNIYVSHDGTVRTIHRFDLNQDGYLDLIFNNTHDSITYVDATWAGFDSARTLTHSSLAVLGSLGAVAGDLNRDGFTDLVFCPNADGIQHPRRFISIAWGSAEGWSSNRISGVLPAWDPRAVAIADLNHDHWPDIVVLAQAPRRQPGGKPVESMVMKVFWGGRLGFYVGRRQIRELPMSVDMKAADFDADGARDIAVLTAENEIRIFWASSEPSAVPVGLNSTRIPLSGPAAGCLAAGDIDGDGLTDLVAGTSHETLFTVNAGSHRNWSHPVRRQAAPASHISIGDLDGDGRSDLVAMNSGHGGHADFDVGAHILWGTSRGFDLEGHRTILSENHLSSGNVADLDRDGYLDLILNGFDPAQTVLYYGSETGFHRSRRLVLPSVLTVADFNRDGFLDLFAPSYHGTGVRESMPSYLFWGSRDGLRAENKTRLVCDSASDAMAGDFDQDGRLDLAVICHTRHGDHRIDSKVFYNDGKRFTAPRTEGLPTLGGHTIYLTDVGHIYDRSWRQTYDSSVFHWDDDRSGGRLEAKAETPAHSRLSFRVRSGADVPGLEHRSWRRVSGDRFSLESGDRVLQYRAVFESGNGDSYPILDRVSIELSSR